jgi:hypothetical protein
MMEKDLVDALGVACDCPSYYGMQPQPDDGAPAPLPVVITNRSASEWFGAFCGTDTRLSNATIQVDYYADTAEAARRMADTGRDVLASYDDNGASGTGTLDSEVSYYDEESRAWRVMQRWTIPDYHPSIS